jgi:hypothetical protein
MCAFIITPTGEAGPREHLQRHKQLHHVVSQLVEIVDVAVKIRHALVSLVTIVIQNDGVADPVGGNGGPGHGRAILRPA